MNLLGILLLTHPFPTLLVHELMLLPPSLPQKDDHSPQLTPHSSLPGASAITHLSPLRPEWRVQLPMREQPVFQAREELQEVSSLGEAEGWPLDPILADQHHCPAAVHCHHDPARGDPMGSHYEAWGWGTPGTHIPPGRPRQSQGPAPRLWERPGQKVGSSF